MQTTLHIPRRAMVLDFDSQNQADRWVTGYAKLPERPDDPASCLRSAQTLEPSGRLSATALSWFTGTLRTADMLSDTVLLTDAQLLDGCFFQGLGVDRVHALIGRRDVEAPAFTIIGRGGSLEESLRSLVAEASGRLRPFTYSVLRAFGQDPATVAERLPGVDAQAVLEAPAGSVAHAAAESIASGLDSTEQTLDLLARRWSEWVEAEQIGRISYERFRSPQDGAWDLAVARWHTPVLEDPSVRDAVHALRQEPNRGTALRKLALSGLTASRYDELAAWYEKVYADFIARNNGADWIDITGGRPAEEHVVPVVGVRARTVTLRGQAPKHLGDMPQSQYELLCYRARGALEGWRANPSPAAANRIAYAIERAQVQDDLTADRHNLLVGLLATLVVTASLLLLDVLAPGIPVGAWFLPLATLALTMLMELRAALAPIRAVSRSALRSTVHITAGA